MVLAAVVAHGDTGFAFEILPKYGRGFPAEEPLFVHFRRAGQYLVQHFRRLSCVLKGLSAFYSKAILQCEITGAFPLAT
jgi:hypothetical protein